MNTTTPATPGTEGCQTCAAGTTSNDGASVCTTLLCETNQHVVNNACVACAAGKKCTPFMDTQQFKTLTFLDFFLLPRPAQRGRRRRFRQRDDVHGHRMRERSTGVVPCLCPVPQWEDERGGRQCGGWEHELRPHLVCFKSKGGGKQLRGLSSRDYER